jgi:hypothetical protein
MNRRDEFHRPEPTGDKAESIALIVVSVPDRDVVLAAQPYQLVDNIQIERSAVRNPNESRASGLCPPLEEVKTVVAERIQVRTDAIIAHLL